MTFPFGETNLVVGALLLGAFGFLECFFGYRLFRVILAIAGAVIGAGFAMGLVNSNQTAVLVIAGLVGGLIGGTLFYYLYFIGTFLAGIALGSTVGALVAANLNATSNAATIIVIVGAVIGGILGILFSKYIIMLSTAFTGAAQMIYALALLFPGVRLVQQANQVQIRLDQTHTIIMSLAVLILGAIGFAVQYNMSRHTVLVSHEHPLA